MDLNRGESQNVTLSDSTVVNVRLIAASATKDSIRDAVRSAQATVEIDGRRATVECGEYHLPVTMGPVQIDCPVTGAVNANTDQDAWALEKDVRLRLWSAGSPLVAPGTFVYPIRQRLFATLTQATNEPTYVDGGESARRRKIYYHAGFDMGGAEGLVDVLAAADGIVICRGEEVVPKFRGNPAVGPEDNALVILDGRGWMHRYYHMQTIVPSVTVGSHVRMGQKVGVLGKEGGSGGWAHLHYDLKVVQPSGRWGTEDAYAYVWEAYRNEYHPDVIALARPHHLVVPGERVVLDGTRSWSAHGPIVRYDWTFTDGTRAEGPIIKRTYSRPGEYCETLKVTDAAGHTDYDFAIVLVNERPSPSGPERLPPTIHPAYFPTIDLKPGEPITFLVRSFRTTYGQETWDFGDRSATVKVKSDGNVEEHAKDGYQRTVHSYKKAGTYIVTVDRTNARGERAVGRLKVVIGSRL
ncbi:MAG TPA: PKD domain-containing protein [Candidatus Sulfotelmatobacter sp.]|nr:PKD domain-containing protein [Candidatus Sulfotelmatobacter sp.]